jgi:hypothetical protein
MEFTVTELPSELHITIATYLDVADLHAFATTNSTYVNLFSPTVVREILQGIAITELMPYPQLFRQFYQPHYFLDNYEAFTHQVVQWLLGKSKSIAASLIYLLSYSVLENPKYQSTLYDFLISEAVQRSGCSAAILDNDAFFEYHIISKSTGYQYIATNLIITNPLPRIKTTEHSSMIIWSKRLVVHAMLSRIHRLISRSLSYSTRVSLISKLWLMSNRRVDGMEDNNLYTIALFINT